MYSCIRKYDTNIHILSVDLKTDKLELVGTWDNSLYTVPNLKNNNHLDGGYKRVGAINGGFFQGNGYSIGWEMIDYSFLNSEGWKDGIYDLFLKDSKLIIDDADINKYNSEYKNKAQWGLSASYCLVRNGKKDLSGSEKFSHSLTYNPRSFIGQKADGTILLIACDGRNKNNSKGLTASQQAQICLDLGCINAINLDGGGSTTLEYNGKIMNTPSDGNLRKVANALVVYSKEKQQEVKDMTRIVLDAGHGYNTPGKRTPDDIREWYMNDKVCRFIEEKLIANYHNVEVYRTDDRTGKTDVARPDRVKYCNNYNPDLFVSIHHNATDGSWVDNVTGTEVYWHTNGTLEDKKIASIVAPKLSAHTGLKNRGVKQAAFDVLGCRATAILVEGGFMNSRIDHPVITTWGMEAYANAIIESIVEYFGLKAKEPIPVPTPDPEPTPEPTKFYRVLCGSYSVRENAEAQKKKLEAAGFKTDILIYEK